MNNRTDVIKVFQSLYRVEEMDVMPSLFEEDSSSWTRHVDKKTGKVHFVNRKTKIDIEGGNNTTLASLFSKTLDKKKRLKSRIKFHKNENQLSKTDYLEYYERENRERVLMARRKHAAILFQREYRRSKARWAFKQYRRNTRAAKILQCIFRKYRAKRIVKRMIRENAAASVIQKHRRAIVLLRLAKVERERKRIHKEMTIAAEVVQRRWRIKRAYMKFVQRRAKWKMGAMTRVKWDRYMDRLTGHDYKPIRTWRVYEEWHAAELDLGSTFSRDDYFSLSLHSFSCTHTYF